MFAEKQVNRQTRSKIFRARITTVPTFGSVWTTIIQEEDKIVKKTASQVQETDRQMKKLQKTFGDWKNCLVIFRSSFENGQKNFFGERFDEIAKNLKNRWQGFESEYDIVLYNSSVDIVEVLCTFGTVRHPRKSF